MESWRWILTSINAAVVGFALTYALAHVFGSIWLRWGGLGSMALAALQWGLLPQAPGLLLAAVTGTVLGPVMWLLGHRQWARQRGWWKSRLACRAWTWWWRRRAPSGASP